jgi:hypothetical protein
MSYKPFKMLGHTLPGPFQQKKNGNGDNNIVDIEKENEQILNPKDGAGDVNVQNIPIQRGTPPSSDVLAINPAENPTDILLRGQPTIYESKKQIA